MMERLWDRMLEQFGQEVVLRQGETETTVRAFVQPVLDRGEDQEVHGSLGLGQKSQFRYFGPARCPVDLDTVVEHGGQEFRVRSAHLVGEGVCPYWWAMLFPREEAAV